MERKRDMTEYSYDEFRQANEIVAQVHTQFDHLMQIDGKGILEVDNWKEFSINQELYNQGFLRKAEDHPFGPQDLVLRMKRNQVKRSRRGDIYDLETAEVTVGIIETSLKSSLLYSISKNIFEPSFGLIYPNGAYVMSKFPENSLKPLQRAMLSDAKELLKLSSLLSAQYTNNK